MGTHMWGERKRDRKRDLCSQKIFLMRKEKMSTQFS